MSPSHFPVSISLVRYHMKDADKAILLCNSFLKAGDLMKETLNTVMLDVSYRDVFSDVVLIEKSLTDVEEAYLRPHAIY